MSTTTHQRFGLTLMVNHACNLRCSYCYTGAKFNSAMPYAMGVLAIDRALHSLDENGQLDLSFFGGEPLLESNRILEWMDYARAAASRCGRTVKFNLTTNGTVTNSAAWRVMTAEDVDITVSFDGNPAHDHHRRNAQGQGSAAIVEATLKDLMKQGVPVRINMVVRPDTLEQLPEGLVYSYQLGIRQIDLSLDLWTVWTTGDGVRLQRIVGEIARLWRQWLPQFSLNWFDVKAGALAGLSVDEQNTRCGFGNGEIAVAPSGRLYPCERLIGEDLPTNPLQLPGHVSQGDDFLNHVPAAFEKCAPCSKCTLTGSCETLCRCSNFIRTGNVNQPDGLLCILNKVTARATSEVITGEPTYA